MGGECNLMANWSCMPTDPNDPRVGIPGNGLGACLIGRDDDCHPKPTGNNTG
jgi:hypothetical protein